METNRIKEKSFSLLLFLFGVFLLSSCSSVHSLKEREKYASGYCYPEIQSSADTLITPETPFFEGLRKDSLLLSSYAEQDIVLAQAIGIAPQLRQLVQLEHTLTVSSDPEKRMKIVELRQFLLQKLTLASVTVSSMAAELDCEGDRANQLASYLDEKEENLNTKLTAASILLGAIASIVTVSLSAGDAYYGIGIGGGIGSASLALATLYPNQKIIFHHPRNLLSDIWYQPKRSSVYPPFIWYIFNEKSFSNSKEYSICHNLRERWILFGQLGNDGSKKREKAIALFFGKTGKYKATELHIRSDMVNHVQSSIRLINQNLQSLMLRLAK